MCLPFTSMRAHQKKTRTPCLYETMNLLYELRTKLLVGENAITKCGWSPTGFAAFECGLWAIIDSERSLSHFNVQGNFLLLCSYTIFVGYSYFFNKKHLMTEHGYPWNTWLRRISLEHLVENTKLTRRPKSWQ